MGLSTITLSDEDKEQIAAVQDLPGTAESNVVEPPKMAWSDQDASLVLIHGPRSRRFRLRPPGPLSVGRDQGNDLALDWPSVSRRHAEVVLSGNNVAIRDLGSTNGTEVNSLTVKEQELRDGDEVAVGEVKLRYMVAGVKQCSQHDLLYRRARADSISTTYSMQHLMHILEREASRSHRYKRPFCLLALGLDGIKSLTESNRSAGIQVMRRLAMLIRNNIRRADSLARLSHNELAIVLPEIEIDGARALGEKLCELVAGTDFEVGEELIRGTISVGAAAHNTDSSDASIVLVKASEQLRRARSEGGGRVAA